MDRKPGTPTHRHTCKHQSEESTSATTPVTTDEKMSVRQVHLWVLPLSLFVATGKNTFYLVGKAMRC